MKTIKALVISDDETIPVSLKDIEPTLDCMKAAIGGGWLEGIGGAGWLGYVDEEGKIKGMPVNVRATRLARLNGWPPGDTLCGPAILLGPVDREGDDTSVGAVLIGTATLLGYL